MGVPATSLGAPATRPGALATSFGEPATTLGAPRIIVEQSGKSNIFVGNAACAPENYTCYILFNDF